MASRSSAFPSPRQLRALLASARNAVAEVGAFVERRARAGGVSTRRKGEGDFVTEVDLDAERRLARLLLLDHPDVGFLGEESGLRESRSELHWVVDPIDGTSNFAHGLVPFAVSVACLCRGTPVVAAAYCAPRGELFTAVRGGGAYLGSKCLRIGRGRLDDASVVGVQWIRGPHRLRFVMPLLASGTRVRNLGCTVAQLCDVAAGRLDGNVQEQGKIWDLAAAALIAVEAGARATSWRGQPLLPFPSLDGALHHHSLVAPPAVHRGLLAALRPAR